MNHHTALYKQVDRIPVDCGVAFVFFLNVQAFAALAKSKHKGAKMVGGGWWRHWDDVLFIANHKGGETFRNVCFFLDKTMGCISNLTLKFQ